MKVESLIKTLVDEAITYGATIPEGNRSLESFITYLHKKDVSAPTRHILNLSEHDLDREIIIHISRLYRYANAYLKYSLTETSFSTDMDFTFTAILQRYGPMSKMELIRKMVYEKSSGMEIIKRLLRMGLIAQTTHPEDKRSKLLKLTPKGEAEILAACQKTGPAAQTVSLPLTDHEKGLLFGILSKLDSFHLKQYLENRSDPSQILGSHEANNN